MVDKVTFNTPPRRIAEQPEDFIQDPQLLANWIYEATLELEKTASIDFTASNGVILIGTDFQHADTSEILNGKLTGAQVLSSFTFDGFGHAQEILARELSPADIGAEPSFAKNTAFNRNFGTSPNSVQEGDAGLGSIAGLTTAADTMIYTTAFDAYAITVITSFGRSLVDDANASTARATLGLGSMATQGSGGVTITGGSINGTAIGSTTEVDGKFSALTATGETFLNLPTAATGTSGSLWNDLGTVKVVP